MGEFEGDADRLAAFSAIFKIRYREFRVLIKSKRGDMRSRAFFHGFHARVINIHYRPPGRGKGFHKARFLARNPFNGGIKLNMDRHVSHGGDNRNMRPRDREKAAHVAWFVRGVFQHQEFGIGLPDDEAAERRENHAAIKEEAAGAAPIAENGQRQTDFGVKVARGCAHAPYGAEDRGNRFFG